MAGTDADQTAAHRHGCERSSELCCEGEIPRATRAGSGGLGGLLREGERPSSRPASRTEPWMERVFSQ